MTDRYCPLFRGGLDCQVDYLLRRVIGWKQLPLFDRFANDAVQRLNGVGRVDHFSFVLRVVEQRVEILPMGAPGVADLEVFIVPSVREFIQRR